MKSLSCPNTHRPHSKKGGTGAIIHHGFYRTRWGKRRRYYCQACGKTFCSNTGTPYHRLQHRRATFDEVATLSVEGLSKSAIARVKHIGWNTVHRWLEKAGASCRRFSNRKIKGLSIVELQADEIRTIVGAKERQVWVFVAIDVWSRLWPSTVVGKRACRDTLNLFKDPDEPRNYSSDHDRRIQVLRDSHLGQAVSMVRSSRHAGMIEWSKWSEGP